MQKNDMYSKEELDFVQKCKLQGVSEDDVVLIYRKLNYKIDKIVVADKEYAVNLQRNNNGYNNLNNNVYAYRFKDSNEIKKITENINKALEKYTELRSIWFEYSGNITLQIIYKYNKIMIPFRNLSTLEDEDKKLAFNRIVLAYRRKKAFPDKEFILNMEIVKCSENAYWCLLYFCADFLTEERMNIIIEDIFGNININDVHLWAVENKGVTPAKSKLYWKKIISLEKQYNIDNSTKNNGRYENEIYSLDSETFQLLNNMKNSNSISFDSIFTVSWGLILAKFKGMNDILIGCTNDSGKLRIVPIKVDCRKSIVENIKFAAEQILEGPNNSMCSLEDILVDYSNSNRFSVSLAQNFILLNNHYEWLNKLPDNKIHKIERIDFSNIPIIVSYVLRRDTMKIEYSYKDGIYSVNDIESLNNTFISVIKGVAKTLTSKKQMEIKIADSKNNDKLKLLQKTDALVKSGLFKRFDNNEIMDLAEQCSINNYLSGDIVLNAKSLVDCIYIVKKGKIEVEMMSKDGSMKTLQILKEGAIFGVESLLESSVTNKKYTVYSDMATIVEIPKSDFVKMSSMNYDILYKIIEMQSKEIAKFQKLWLMQ